MKLVCPTCGRTTEHGAFTSTECGGLPGRVHPMTLMVREVPPDPLPERYRRVVDSVMGHIERGEP